MKKFSFKLALVSLPIFFVFLIYIILDPFKVVYNYNSYYNSNDPTYIGTNRDFVTFQAFKNNYKKHQYDSFIFGNSRSEFYKVKTWEKYIKNGSCFHFDAYGESLYGVYIKFKYLHSHNIKIKNALLLLDCAYLLERVSNSSGRLFLKHPELSGQNKLAFHFENFKAFLSLDFLLLFWQHTILGQVTPKILDTGLFAHDVKTNEIRWDYFESVIAANPDQYYTKEKMATFFKRSPVQKYSPAVIKSDQIKMLQEIKKILALNNTNYKIIISPVYDQLKLNEKDLDKLNEVFGKENVYDFSGINSISDNYLNFYDSQSHPRPHVTDYIMEQLYKK